MDQMLFYYPDGHAGHAESGHPERPERVEAVRSALQEAGWWHKYKKIKAEGISESVLEAIHAPPYLARLQEVSARGQRFDLDTYTTTRSWELALNAAGGAVALAGEVWQRRARRGFALTRPPGHHATRNRAMGFCLLNNVAIAAQHLLAEAGARRLAIVDLDLHHGNGTQDIFYRRGDVLYISTHQSPLYPGTGSLEETGAGEGSRTNANFPLPPFSGDVAFAAVLAELALPLLDIFSPEMILVSYGFDPHWQDPLGNLLLSAQVYGELIALLAGWADRNCDGRIALFLEGGYSLEAGGACSQAVVAALLGEPWEDSLGPAPHPAGTQWQDMVSKAKMVWNL